MTRGFLHTSQCYVCVHTHTHTRECCNVLGLVHFPKSDQNSDFVGIKYLFSQANNLFVYIQQSKILVKHVKWVKKVKNKANK